MFDLSGKTALVTGASGGIGGAIAKALHGQGAKVVLSGTRAEALEAVRAELGERAFIAPANLSDIASVEALPKAAEACPHGLAPTTSTTMQLAIGDALAIALLEGKGFTASDFRVFHPGGRLGAGLTHVRDLMHKDQEIPLVGAGTAMADAILAMSEKSFGCVGVVDQTRRLIGIVTDGDLRRHMNPGLLAAAIDDVMTRQPRTVAPDTIASAALEIMNSSKIMALFVVEDGRPVGILHLHDVLRAGVA